jgi:competence protein ComEA
MNLLTKSPWSSSKSCAGRTWLVTSSALFGVVFGLSVSSGYVVLAKQQGQPPTTPSQSQDHPEFPPGPGREVTLRTCSKCHSPNILLATGRTQDGWEEIITKMTTLGLEGTDEQFTAILDYLTASFPLKVNVNKAAAPQFVAVLALTPQEAAALVSYREKNGEYKTIDDLKKVAGVNPTKIEAKKDLLQF